MWRQTEVTAAWAGRRGGVSRPGSLRKSRYPGPRPGTLETHKAEADFEGRGGAPQSEPKEVAPKVTLSCELREASPLEAPGGILPKKSLEVSYPGSLQKLRTRETQEK